MVKRIPFWFFMSHVFFMYTGIALQNISLLVCTIGFGYFCFFDRCFSSQRAYLTMGLLLTCLWLIWPASNIASVLFPMHESIQYLVYAGEEINFSVTPEALMRSVELRKMASSLVPSSVLISGIFFLVLFFLLKRNFLENFFAQSFSVWREKGEVLTAEAWIKALFFASLILACYFSYQHFTGFDFRLSQRYLSNMQFPNGTYRIQGFSGHPLTIGSIALAMVGFSSVLLYHQLQTKGKSVWYLAGILIVNLFFLYASGGRTAQVFGAVWLFLLAGVFMKTRMQLWSFAVLICASLALAAVAFFSLPLFDRFHELFDELSSGSALPNRVVFWQVHWQMFLDSPAWGQGIAWMNQGIRTMYFDGLGFRALNEKFNAHNIYFEILAGTGLIGFFGHFLFGLQFFEQAGRLFKVPRRSLIDFFRVGGASKKIDVRTLYIALVVAVGLNLLHGFTQNTFFDSGVVVFYAHLFWFVFWVAVEEARSLRAGGPAAEIAGGPAAEIAGGPAPEGCGSTNA